MTAVAAPRVVSIVYRPRDAAEPKPQGHFARVPLDRVRLIESHGIDGDAKGGSGDRQLNVMLAEALAELATRGVQNRPGGDGRADHHRRPRSRVPGGGRSPQTRLRRHRGGDSRGPDAPASR